MPDVTYTCRICLEDWQRPGPKPGSAPLVCPKPACKRKAAAERKAAQRRQQAAVPPTDPGVAFSKGALRDAGQLVAVPASIERAVQALYTLGGEIYFAQARGQSIDWQIEHQRLVGATAEIVDALNEYFKGEGATILEEVAQRPGAAGI